MQKKNSQYVMLTDDGGLLVHMIGWEPRHKPYLTIRKRDGFVIDTITGKNRLRGLAHRILAAIGDDNAHD